MPRSCSEIMLKVIPRYSLHVSTAIQVGPATLPRLRDNGVGLERHMFCQTSSRSMKVSVQTKHTHTTGYNRIQPNSAYRIPGPKIANRSNERTDYPPRYTYREMSAINPHIVSWLESFIIARDYRKVRERMFRF